VFVRDNHRQIRAFSGKTSCAFGASPKLENRVQGVGSEWTGQSVVQAFRDGGCWRSGNAGWASITSVRLTRVRKSTTIGRIQKRRGRIAVSVTDLRRSNRLLQGKCFANHGRTWLGTGYVSGHGNGLLVIYDLRPVKPHENRSEIRLADRRRVFQLLDLLYRRKLQEWTKIVKPSPQANVNSSAALPST
jgi:hypothetical protein